MATHEATFAQMFFVLDINYHFTNQTYAWPWKFLNFMSKCFPISFIKFSGSEVLCEKGALKNFTKSTGKQLCQSLTWLRHRCFPVKFVEFLKTLALWNPRELLLLHTVKRCGKNWNFCSRRNILSESITMKNHGIWKNIQFMN